jgi:hypothetical protein
MQEGTIWRSELWSKVGGVRRDLRLAGDFDLWRRFGAEAAYASVDTVLAAHRRREGQLSENPIAYFAELDALMEPYVEARDREWERFQRWRERSPTNREESFQGTRLSCETGQWVLGRAALPALFNTTIHVSADGVRRSLPAQFISGFLAESAQSPCLNVPLGCRWLHEGVGILQFQAAGAGVHRLRVRVRNFSDQVVITIKHSGRRLFHGTIPVTCFDRDCEISVDADFEAGTNTVALFLEPPQAEKRPDLLIVACEAAPAS